MTDDWHHQIEQEIVEPKDIHGLPNGQFPDSALEPSLDHLGHQFGRISHTVARAWRAMCAAAWADKIFLTATDAYRNLALQQHLWDVRYDHTNHHHGGRSCGGDYRYLKDGMAVVACPGTSNHGRGLAFDINLSVVPGVLPWLEANAKRFGFQWEVESEAWHLHYFPGDAIPQAVLDFEHSAPAHPTQQEEDMFVTKITAGDDHGKIFYVVYGSYLEIDQASADHLTHDGVRYQPLDDISWAQTKRQLTPSK